MSYLDVFIGTTKVDPTMLAGGIWAALLTTAAGLTIAIPALAAHTCFESLLEKLRVHMKDASVQILGTKVHSTDSQETIKAA